MRPKRLGIVLVLIWFYFSVTVTSATQEPIVFTGTGNVTTDTFDCYGHGKITWTTIQEITGEYSLEPSFSAFINELEPSGRSSSVQFFSGLSGTTHLYANGTFCFQMYILTSIKSWRITVENLDMPQFGLTTTTVTEMITETHRPVTKTIITIATEEKTMQEFGTPVLLITVLFAVLMAINQRRKRQ